ncbi:MAG TPA: hypothetical protein VMY42_18000 [Thermoguttaceae bacterium]|nr:hypothetical protein [Thermoguttaceae bacterium]
MIQEGLISLLLNTSAVTDLASTRIAAVARKQDGVLPAITIQEIANERMPCHDGANSYCVTRLQVNCLASSQGGAKALFEQVRIATHCVTSGWGDETVSAAFMVDDGELPLDPSAGLDVRRVYGHRGDLEVTWAESTS